MRIVHATDIHFTCVPSLAQLWGKRMWGTFNLYALGRAKRFSLQVQRQLVAAMASVKPDVVLITGDLTSQALESEFELARTELQGLLDAAPRGSFVIPGNHCVYTRPAAKQRLLQRYFGKWMDDGPDVQARRALPTFRAGGVRIVGLDPNQPTVIGSNGYYPEWQLRALERALAPPHAASSSSDTAAEMVILATHYPLLDRGGKEYTSVHRWHGASNNADLLRVLARAATKPALVVHGHDHDGYASALALPIRAPAPPPPPRAEGPAVDEEARAHDDAHAHAHAQVLVPVHNPGSGGYSFARARATGARVAGMAADKSARFAAFNVYDVHTDSDGNGSSLSASARPSAAAASTASASPQPHAPVSALPRGWRLNVARFVHDGVDFVPELTPYTFATT